MNKGFLHIACPILIWLQLSLLAGCGSDTTLSPVEPEIFAIEADFYNEGTDNKDPDNKDPYNEEYGNTEAGNAEFPVEEVLSETEIENSNPEAAKDGNTINIAVAGEINKAILEKALESEKGYSFNLIYTEDDHRASLDMVLDGKVEGAVAGHKGLLRTYMGVKGRENELSICDWLFYRPVRLFAASGKAQEELNNSTIAIADSMDTLPRALMLLRDKGHIQLREGISHMELGLDDIIQKPDNMELILISPGDVGSNDSYDYVMADSFQAMKMGYTNTEAAIYTEAAGSEGVYEYGVPFIISSETEGGSWKDVLSKAVKSGEVRDFLYKEYGGGVIICRPKEPS